MTDAASSSRALIERLLGLQEPAEVGRFLAAVGYAHGLEFQTAVVRHRATPLAEALSLFWWLNPAEGDLMTDRSSAIAGLQLELIKRVEIGYYPKAGLAWSCFEPVRPGEAEIADALDRFQGIVPRCMLGTDFA